MDFADCASSPVSMSIVFGFILKVRNMRIGCSKGRTMAVGLLFDMLEQRRQANW
jgi:hypothetical protein